MKSVLSPAKQAKWQSEQAAQELIAEIKTWPVVQSDLHGCNRLEWFTPSKPQAGKSLEGVVVPLGVAKVSK